MLGGGGGEKIKGRNKKLLSELNKMHLCKIIATPKFLETKKYAFNCILAVFKIGFLNEF